MMNNLMLILTGKRPLIDVWHYLLGHYRYKLYYNRKVWNGYTDTTLTVKNYEYKKHPLMRKHIKEQIDYRIRWMDQECYLLGSCKICGCQTTALQMSNKSCDKPCYPPMMNKTEWRYFNKNIAINFSHGLGATVKLLHPPDGYEIWIKSPVSGKPLLKRYNAKEQQYIQIN